MAPVSSPIFGYFYKLSTEFREGILPKFARFGQKSSKAVLSGVPLLPIFLQNFKPDFAAIIHSEHDAAISHRWDVPLFSLAPISIVIRSAFGGERGRGHAVAAECQPPSGLGACRPKTRKNAG